MTIAYRPSGRFTLIGLILMLVFGLAGALLGSYIYFLFQKHLVTVIGIFGAGLGILAGGGVALGVSWGKVRSPFIAGFLGLIFGLFAFVLTCYWNYQDLQKELQTYFSEEETIYLPQSEIQQMLDGYYQDEYGYVGVVGYIFDSITYDQYSYFQIGSSGADYYESENDAPSLGDKIFRVLFDLLDLVAAGGSGVGLALVAATARFCEKDKRWFDERQILKSSLESGADLAKALLAGNFIQALNYVSLPQNNKEIILTMEVCPKCQDGYLKIKARNGSKQKEIYQSYINPSMLPEYEWLENRAKTMLDAMQKEQKQPNPKK